MKLDQRKFPFMSLSTPDRFKNETFHNIKYLTETVRSAVVWNDTGGANDNKKDIDRFNNMIDNSLEISSTYLFSEAGKGIRFYASLGLVMKDKTWKARLVINDPKQEKRIVFDGSGYFANMNNDNSTIAYTNIYCSDSRWNQKEATSQIGHYVRMCVRAEIFLKYAEIENKILPPKKKLKEHNCFYDNQLSNEVQIIDSTWWTNIVKSEGFNVRGHFRLQPCGEGKKDKKLIWINDFQKKGYVRTFKRPILIEN